MNKTDPSQTQNQALSATARAALQAARQVAAAARRAAVAAAQAARQHRREAFAAEVRSRAAGQGEPNPTLHLPKLQLEKVAALGPCQVLAVTAVETQLAPLDYALAADAISAKSLIIKEVDSGGSVPTLLVENRLDQPVLILEGDLLIGGKQNRLSNFSVLIPAETKMPLPVSCIEHGRWGHRSPEPESFAPSMDCIAAPVHRELKRSKFAPSMASAQSKIWDSIDDMQTMHSYASTTSDHEELLRVSRRELEDFLDSAQCPKDAIGVAVVVGDASYALDLFDRVETCRHYWQMKIHSSLMQRGTLSKREEPFSTAALEQDIEELQDDRWKVGQRTDRTAQNHPGLGSELQTRTEKQSLATALAYEQVPVHLNMVSQN